MEVVAGGSNMDEVYISRATLISYYKKCPDKGSKYENFLQKVKKAICTEDLSSEIKNVLSKLIHDYKAKMKVARYNVVQFNRKNKDWMQTNIAFPVDLQTLTKKLDTSGESGGRPSKDFTQSSDRSKRRKTEEIRKKYSPRKLVYAAQMEYRAEGELAASKILKDITIHGPKEAEKYTRISDNHCQKQISADKALSLFLEAGLTKSQYNLIVACTREANCNLFPQYEAITEAKSNCYPEHQSVTEVCAEVPLQSLLNHTSRRLCLSLAEGIDSLTDNQRNNLCLITKWGCDGSGCHSQYNQRFQNEDYDDSYMFITSIVPIRLVCNEEDTEHKVIVWQNPRPSSTRYCRPLRLQIIQETTQTSKAETIHVENQIARLEPTVVQLNGKSLCVNHHLQMTMVDGKMVNAVTDTTSAQRCYLCGLTIKDFNRIHYCIKQEIRENSLQLGISSLHAWIRFAECILHVGYKLRICKYQAKGTEAKNSVKSEKKRIQKEFFRRLGLHVDKPRQGGGTSTTGNVARALILRSDITSEVTGVHKDLIENFYVILSVLSSGYEICTPEFKKYCLRTAQKFVFLYPWYKMPTTLHKVLIHGAAIIEKAETAIGLLSEDAQEARNKDVRAYRQRYSRKFSRVLTLTDTYQRLLATSDPYITGLRKLPRKTNGKPLPESALPLLREPDIEK